jgi:hypothetical protein
MTKDELELAKNCYGYGRWSAPYWFIGLEEGQALSENNDFTKRAEAFRKLNKNGLCDCAKFHKEIRERRSHEIDSQSGNVKLQRTWRYLILLLMAFRGISTENDERRSSFQKEYQRNRWGAESDSCGETCVVELSGLPANNTKVSKKRPEAMRRQLEGEIRRTRISRIKNMLKNNTKPKFVVMYGLSEKKLWREIAGHELQAGIPKKDGDTTFLLALQPAARYEKGQKDQYWTSLGSKLRAEMSQS